MAIMTLLTKNLKSKLKNWLYYPKTKSKSKTPASKILVPVIKVGRRILLTNNHTACEKLIQFVEATFNRTHETYLVCQDNKDIYTN